jgi:hypothetical protein
MLDDELLERVRELRARGRSPKEIARTLKVRPATVTPLIRRLAASEPQDKEASLIGCWVNQGQPTAGHVADRIGNAGVGPVTGAIVSNLRMVPGSAPARAEWTKLRRYRSSALGAGR